MAWMLNTSAMSFAGLGQSLLVQSGLLVDGLGAGVTFKDWPFVRWRPHFLSGGESLFL